MAEKVEFELVAKTSGAVDAVNKVDEAVKKTSKATKKASKELSGMQQVGNEAVKGLDKLTGGLASKLVAVGKAAKLSGKAMKTALISSGIGLAVVAVGLLVEYWDEIGEALGFINKDLERQIELNNQNLDAVGLRLRNIQTLIELRKREGKDVNLLLKKEKELTEQKKQALITSIQDQAVLLNRLKLKQQEGKLNEEDTKELIKQEGVYLDLINNFNKFKSDLLEPVKEVVKKDTSASEAEKLAEQQRLKAIDDKAASIEEITKLEDDFLQSQLDKQTQEENAVRDKYFTLIEEADKYKLDTTLLEEARQSELDLIAKTFEDKKLADEVLRLDAIKKIQDDHKEITDIERLEQEQVEALAELTLLEATEEEKFAIKKFYSDAIQDVKDENAEIEKKTSQELLKQGLEDAKRTFDMVGQLAGEDSKVGKAMAIASATISGIQGTMNAYTTAQKSPITTLFPAYPIVQASLAGLVAAKNIAAIKSINPSGGGGGSVPTQSGGGGSTPPAFNVVGQSDTNQLADAIGGQAQRPARAFVVSNDVTTAQELDRNIIEGASIG
jgi:hypothetical protein